MMIFFLSFSLAVFISLSICPSIKIMQGHVGGLFPQRAQEPVGMMIWAGRFWGMLAVLRAGYEKGMTYDVWFPCFRGCIHSLFVFFCQMG